MKTLTVTDQEYKRFIRHARMLINNIKSDARPVLKGINHYVNGDLVVTDGHRLYYGKNFHNKDLERDVTLSSTGKKIEGKYPNVERLFPSNPESEIRINVNEYFKATDFLNTANVANKDSPMRFEKNVISINGAEIQAKYTLPDSLPKDARFSSNVKYWYQALRMFKEFRYTEVNFSFHGPLRPFTLVSPDKRLTAIIMPVRSH